MNTRGPAPTVKIALIGLDRVTASIGLALRPRDGLRLTAFDRDNEAARLAQSRGLVHEAKWNLLDAADGADLVLVGGPLTEQQEWFKALAPELGAGAVVACLGPLLAPPLAWAATASLSDRHVVAAHPILNPADLYDGGLGLDAARADLFQKGLWALAPAPACAPEAVKLVADLAVLLGAQPYYMDAAEHDGLLGATHGLPPLLAAALLRAAEASPGWGEARKAADRGFATATFALTDADAAALTANRDNVLRYLDAALAALQSLRDLVASGDRLRLDQTLAELAARRAEWARARARGEWEKPERAGPELPTFGETIGRMFVGGLLKRRDKDR